MKEYKSKSSMGSPSDIHKILKVDSHQHFWQRDLGYYHWLNEDMPRIFRDFSPEDLRPLLKQSDISHTVLVQAAPELAETEFILSLAESTDFVAGVVGWVDMQDPNVISVLARLASNRYFKGIRPMLQDIHDDNWMLQENLTPAFTVLSSLGLCFDALVKPRHLSALYTLAKKYRELKIVIDHAGKPSIANQQYGAWAQDITALASLPNVYCKLSGLVTEAGVNPDLDSLEPYMSHLYQSFGAHRLMWGSDWPVLNLATDYDQWVSLTEVFVEPFSQQEQQRIWGGTAIDFYQLNDLR